jgi:dinuclear metal center YbgI/SA1388 family protein
MTVNEVYSFLEKLAPFKYQESYDNSGFLVGAGNAAVTGICLCLDITHSIITEAAEKGANLIISHHPVIFKALSAVKANTPVHSMVKHEINAICAHTNFDAVVMADVMLEKLDLPKNGGVIEAIGTDGAGMGKISTMHEFISADELAQKCKKAFNSPALRYTSSGKFVNRVGVCPGSGGSVLDAAIEKGCHALIAGEFKHSDMVRALNSGLTLIEAGHFSTEIIFCDFLKSKLYEQFPQTPVFIADNAVDFCKYL